MRSCVEFFVEIESFTIRVKKFTNNCRARLGRDNFWVIITLGLNLHDRVNQYSVLLSKQSRGVQRSLKPATIITCAEPVAGIALQPM